MTEESKKEECCSTKKSCCCAGKLITSVVLALLIFGAGYVAGKGNLCFQNKICPFMPQTQPMQTQK